MSRWIRTLAIVATLLAPEAATAHWCNTLWISNYNIVVRPSSDTVTVPSSGPGTVDLYVQNNMGYPLKNFALTATMPSGYTATTTKDAATVTGYLMPGERVKYTLNITRSGGGTFPVEQINFGVSFGDNQSYSYGDISPVVIKKQQSLWPARPMQEVSTSTSWNGQGSQAWSMDGTADADWGSDDPALRYGSLLKNFCAGRNSWSAESSSATYCPDNLAAANCPGRDSSTNAGGADFKHLWAGTQLAARKNGLTAAQLTAFRARLKCAADDGHLGFSGMSMFMLGYLGEESGARTFLTGKVNGTNANEALIAKAALLLFKNASDPSSWKTDVTNGMTNSNVYVSGICQAALAIVDKNDAALGTASDRGRLLGRARWVYPDDEAENFTTSSAAGDGPSLWSSHLLSLVAWERRQWAPNGEEQGSVSFYGEGPVVVDDTPPKAPTGVTCTYDATTDGTVRVNWAQVTQDTSNGSERVRDYTVHYGFTSAGGQTNPDVFTYGHSTTPIASTTFTKTFTRTDWTDPAQRYYVAVTATDQSGNKSAYSTEISCIPHYKPTATLNCTPLTGDAPLTVNCNSTGSSDPNASLDTLTYSFRLNSNAATQGATATYSNLAAGRYTVQLTVTDSTSLSATATATLDVTDPTSQNQAPTAAAALSNPGAAPFRVGEAVAFTSAGSSDPDGDTLTYSWNFGDGATSTDQNPTHTFTSANTYDVILTVSDGTLSATDLVSVDVIGNHAPDLISATASPLSGDAPLTVDFSAVDVFDPEDDAFTLTWKFGDGSADETGTTATHEYSAEGTYTAQLVGADQAATDPATATRSFTITVGHPAPVNGAPDVSGAFVTPLEGPSPLTITMDASGATDPDGDALTYLWTVPLEAMVTETFTTPTATFTLDKVGTTRVTLVVSDGRKESPREFVVTVGEPIARPDSSGYCGCGAAAGTPLLAAAGLVLALLRRRTRR